VLLTVSILVFRSHLANYYFLFQYLLQVNNLLT
jgi:hypothetical protein